jgi:hypothetical protein
MALSRRRSEHVLGLSHFPGQVVDVKQERRRTSVAIGIFQGPRLCLKPEFEKVLSGCVTQDLVASG